MPVRLLAPRALPGTRDVHHVYTRVRRPASRRAARSNHRAPLRLFTARSVSWHTACFTGRAEAVTMPTKILIVDDDERLAQALEQLLNLEGYQATIALSAEAALEKFRTDTFHLVLSDLQLPGRNGISL